MASRTPSRAQIKRWLASTFESAWKSTEALKPTRASVPRLDQGPTLAIAASLLGESLDNARRVLTAPEHRTHAQASGWSGDARGSMKGDFSVRETRRELALPGREAGIVWVDWDVGDNAFAARTGAGFAEDAYRVYDLKAGWAVSMSSTGQNIAIASRRPERVAEIDALVRAHADYVTGHASAWDFSEDPSNARFVSFAQGATGGRPKVDLSDDGAFTITAGRGDKQASLRNDVWGGTLLVLVHLKATVLSADMAGLKSAFAELLSDPRPRDASWLAEQEIRMAHAHDARHGSSHARAAQILETFPNHVDAAAVLALNTGNSRSLDALDARGRVEYAAQLTYGILLFGRGKFADAAACFDGALAARPDDYTAHVYAALSLKAQLPGPPMPAAPALVARAHAHLDATVANPPPPDALRFDARAQGNPRDLVLDVSTTRVFLLRVAGVQHEGCSTCQSLGPKVRTTPSSAVPDGIERLQAHNPTRGDHQHAFFRCRQCDGLYRFHKTYDYDPNGSIDEVTFWRLPPAQQIVLGPVLAPKTRASTRESALLAALGHASPEIRREATLAAWWLAQTQEKFSNEAIDALVVTLSDDHIQTVMRACSAICARLARHGWLKSRVLRSLDRPELPERTKPGEHYAGLVRTAAEG